MALTSYATNAPEAVKLYSRKLAREALSRTSIQKFMGESASSLLQIHNDMKKSAGDRLRIQLMMQLSGSGVVGDGTLEGREEALVTYTDDLEIDQLRHAVRSAGEMSEQRVPWVYRDEAKDRLADWWSGTLDQQFFNSLGGYTPANSVLDPDGNPIVAGNTIVDHDADHVIWGETTAGVTVTDDQSLLSTMPFRLSDIDRALIKAKTLSPLIRPIKFQGEDVYVLFLHPYQVRDLRTNTDTGQWLDIQKAAMQGGDIKSNPIFSGALGMYNGVILHENVRVTKGVDSTSASTAVSNVRRAIFAGAQAGVIGFGKGHSFDNFGWHEEMYDYGNQLGVKAGCIYGLKKTMFNNDNFGVIGVHTWAAA